MKGYCEPEVLWRDIKSVKDLALKTKQLRMQLGAGWSSWVCRPGFASGTTGPGQASQEKRAGSQLVSVQSPGKAGKRPRAESCTGFLRPSGRDLKPVGHLRPCATVGGAARVRASQHVCRRKTREVYVGRA